MPLLPDSVLGFVGFRADLFHFGSGGRFGTWRLAAPFPGRGNLLFRGQIETAETAELALVQAAAAVGKNPDRVGTAQTPAIRAVRKTPFTR